MLRPKNCKRCGGKMQVGGLQLQGRITPDTDLYPLQERMTPDTDIINTPLTPNFATYPSTDKQKKNKRGVFTPFDASLMMRGISTGLQEIAGRVARNRQDQYDMMQQTALGQINPMPVEDYQPNPYSLYAKYGGSLKKYMKGGLPDYSKAIVNAYQNGGLTRGLMPVPSYGYSSTNQFADSSLYRGVLRNEVRTPGQAHDNIARLANSIIKEHNPERLQSLFDRMAVYTSVKGDYDKQMTSEQIQEELNNMPMPKEITRTKGKGGSLVDYMKANKLDSSFGNRHYLFDEMFKEPYRGTAKQNTRILNLFKSGKIPKGELLKEQVTAPDMLPEGEMMRYGGLKHAEYFGPRFSNNAQFKFADDEKIDKRIGRRLVGKLIRKHFNA